MSSIDKIIRIHQEDEGRIIPCGYKHERLFQSPEITIKDVTKEVFRCQNRVNNALCPHNTEELKKDSAWIKLYSRIEKLVGVDASINNIADRAADIKDMVSIADNYASMGNSRANTRQLEKTAIDSFPEGRIQESFLEMYDIMYNNEQSASKLNKKESEKVIKLAQKIQSALVIPTMKLYDDISRLELENNINI